MSQSSTAAYDLHLHTHWSYDATLAVEDHFRTAAELGVRCIAITEHQNADSINEAMACAERYPQVRYIRATELSVKCDLGVCDVLCYGLPHPLPARLRDALRQHHQQAQVDTARVIREGFGLSLQQHRDALLTYRPENVLEVQGLTRVQNGRLAEWLTQAGVIASPDEYRPKMAEMELPDYMPAAEIVPLFRDAGAVSVLAHPHGYFQGADEARMDALRDMLYLDGVECAHPAIPAEFTPIYETYCRKHNLLSTAGSDSHFPQDHDNLFARHGGSDAWLDALLERLDG